MRMMTTTTAQTAPIQIIFYREGDRDKNESIVTMGRVSAEMSPQTKHQLKQRVTNSPLALPCLFSSNQRQELQNKS